MRLREVPPDISSVQSNAKLSALVQYMEAQSLWHLNIGAGQHVVCIHLSADRQPRLHTGAMLCMGRIACDLLALGHLDF